MTQNTTIDISLPVTLTPKPDYDMSLLMRRKQHLVKNLGNHA